MPSPAVATADQTRAAPRRDTLNLRIAPADRNLIDQAAASLGATRTDFILQAVRRAAEETLLDRAVLSFLRRLDAPAQPNERLRRTMQAPSPFGKRVTPKPAG
jgi:uncharacterized protein (DUF1778 family)